MLRGVGGVAVAVRNEMHALLLPFSLDQTWGQQRIVLLLQICRSPNLLQ